MNQPFDSNQLLAPFVASTYRPPFDGGSKALPTLGTIPHDVMKELIQKYLKPAEKIPLAFLCTRFRVLSSQDLASQSKFDLRAAMYLAAFQGQIPLLQWYHTILRCPFNTTLCAYAASGGHLEVLQWLRERGCPWDESTCARASIGGHIDILMWSHANACPWDASVCIAASQQGHLEILKWARAQRCPWNSNCWHLAHQNVHPYLQANDCPRYDGYSINI